MKQAVRQDMTVDNGTRHQNTDTKILLAFAQKKTSPDEKSFLVASGGIAFAKRSSPGLGHMNTRHVFYPRPFDPLTKSTNTNTTR